MCNCNYGYRYGYVQCRLFTIKMCTKCGEAELICNPILAFIWQHIFYHFWDGGIWLD